MRTVLVLAVTTIMLACGKGNKDDSNTDEVSQSKSEESPKVPELQTIDLTTAGIEAVITAPKGATVEAKYGNAIVKDANDNFNVEIGHEHVDIVARKADIEASAGDRALRFLVDEPTALVYRYDKGQKHRSHLIVNVTVGDTKLSCENAKASAYSESNAMAMLEACKSISGKP